MFDQTMIFVRGLVCVFVSAGAACIYIGFYRGENPLWLIGVLLLWMAAVVWSLVNELEEENTRRYPLSF
jgi:hypothetical protein